MKTATVHEIKQELSGLKPQELTELCLRLAKFKKENKELLTYLLFEAHDEAAYMDSVKAEAEALFAEINLSHLYFVKKSLRKILRVLNKHIRYMASDSAGAELLIFFCTLIKESGIPFAKSPVLNNLYQGQLKKAVLLVKKLHEDLQYDLRKQLKRLEE
ncbi:MAG: hypothetical protein JSU05_12720 [Bacteroidetes bacterium]|nr:hypothetical protein [Bacteroidota bacterium]